MRIPKKGPALSPADLQDLAALVAGKPKSLEKPGQYLHWDDIVRRAPPQGLTREDWWKRLKAERNQRSRLTDLQAIDGSRSKFTEPDHIRRLERWLDSFATGREKLAGLSEGMTGKGHAIGNTIEEAFTSSRLEGAVTTREAAGEIIRRGRAPRDKSERMVMNNYAAMQFVKANRDRPLTAAMVCALQGLVTEGTLDRPEMAGRLRRSDEIKVYDADGEVIHTPPPAKELPARLRRLCDFANTNFDQEGASGFIHPAVQASILHFMIGYDHPFVDGNGRTARALFYWLMLRRGYALVEFVSISRILVEAPSQYARAYLLSETDDNDLTYFIDHQLSALRRAFDRLVADAKLEDRAMSDLAHRLAESPLAGKLNRRQIDLLRQLIGKKSAILTIKDHQATSDVSYQTARSDLLALVELKLLSRVGRGPQTSFVAVKGLARRLDASD